MAGFLVVLFKAPFMVILLTVVMLQASAELTALIVLAVAAVHDRPAVHPRRDRQPAGGAGRATSLTRPGPDRPGTGPRGLRPTFGSMAAPGGSPIG